MVQVAVVVARDPWPSSYRHALGYKLGGVGVAQALGVHALFDPRPSAETGEQATHVACVEPAAFERAEQRPPRPNPYGAALVEPALHQGEGGGGPCPPCGAGRPFRAGR